MEQLTFSACVKKSWGSTWQAIVQMPGLLLGSCAVFACITLLSGSFQHTAAESAELDAATRTSHAMIHMALSILQLLVSGCLTIKVHRFVLLGERSQPLVPLGGKPLARYAFFAFSQVFLGMLVALVFILPLYLARQHMGTRLGFIAMIAALLFVYGFIAMRLCLLYPAIALGTRLKLRAAWNDSRGHFWSMWAVSFVASLLPMLVLFVPVLIVTVRHAKAGDTDSASGFAIGLALSDAFFSALFVVLAAAAMSWLYRRYANQLRDTLAQ
jgi:hypothetical protein